jgi:predicted regulator of Ras-like GTPase activity (Roadblock/LC7/MglB family)
MEPTTESPGQGEHPDEGVPRDASAVLLHAFCAEAGVAFAALVDESGAVISSASPRGLAPRNMPEIGAIAAGAFGATTLLSRKLGEGGDGGLYQPGKRWHYFLVPVTEDAFLLSVFDGDTSVGLVRAGAGRARSAMTAALASGRERPFWP